MASLPGPNPAMTLTEYLAFEEQSPERHEWVGGHVFAMAGGTERHDLAVVELFRLFDPEVRRQNCRMFTHNRRLRAGPVEARRAIYYPDLLVRCGPPVDEFFEEDATMVAEVKSPSTVRQDRRDKALAYGALPSLQMYLLVDSVYRVIEVARPAEGTFLRWETFEDVGVILTPYGDLDLERFYGELDAAAYPTWK